MPNPTLTRHVDDAQAALASIVATPSLLADLAVCHFELDDRSQLEARHVAAVEDAIWRMNEVLSSWSTTHPRRCGVAGSAR